MSAKRPCQGRTRKNQRCKNQAKPGQATCGLCKGKLRDPLIDIVRTRVESENIMPLHVILDSMMLSEDELDSLAFSDNSAYRMEAARSGRTHPDTLLAMAADATDAKLLVALADNMRTPAATLVHLLPMLAMPSDNAERGNHGAFARFVTRSDMTPEICETAIDAAFDRSENIGEELLRVLAVTHRGKSYPCQQILMRYKAGRMHLAGNTRTARLLVAELARSDEIGALENLARNTALPTNILETLAVCENESVRRALCNRRVDLPSDIVNMLASDANPAVRAELLRWQKLNTADLTLLGKDSLPEIRLGVAHQLAADSATLTLLAQDKDPKIRAAVATHSNTSAETRIMLASDKRVDVRKEAAARVADEHTLMRLVRDPNPKVRSATADNEYCPLAGLIALAADADADIAYRACLTAYDTSFERAVWKAADKAVLRKIEHYAYADAAYRYSDD